MEHVLIQDCIDYVRGLSDPGRASAISRHLESGCVKCQKQVEAWRRIMLFAEIENRQEAPEASVRVIKSTFAMRKMLASRGNRVELASLVFDSAQQLLAAGTRSGPVSTRQLFYKAGSVCIDMHIQPKLGSETIVLFGQLMDSTPPAHGIGDIPVSLLRGKSTVSQRKTNNLGEFNFGFDAPHHLQLIFGIGERRTLVVPVPEVQIESGRPLA